MGCPELPPEYYFEMLYTYDPDGNSPQANRFTYTWDGENRLIKVESGIGTEAQRSKVEFSYDYMRRRRRRGEDGVILPPLTSIHDSNTQSQRSVHMSSFSQKTLSTYIISFCF